MTAIERIREERLVGLLRAVPDARDVADALVAGGVRVLERRGRVGLAHGDASPERVPTGEQVGRLVVERTRAEALFGFVQPSLVEGERGTQHVHFAQLPLRRLLFEGAASLPDELLRGLLISLDGRELCSQRQNARCYVPKLGAPRISRKGL